MVVESHVSELSCVASLLLPYRSSISELLTESFVALSRGGMRTQVCPHHFLLTGNIRIQPGELSRQSVILLDIIISGVILGFSVRVFQTDVCRDSSEYPVSLLGKHT